MGGPAACTAEISGETADEMAMNGSKHIMEAAAGDAEHMKMKEMMDNSSEDEKATWKKEFQGKFDAAPDA